MRRQVLPDPVRGTHPGLLLSYYLSTDDAAAKAGLMKQAIDALRAILPLYRHAYDRWKANTAPGSGAARSEKVAAVRHRMALGLGRESVVETGVALHHTYGTPILPGSALKGLAAHYCHQVWGSANGDFLQAPAGRNFRVLFGDIEDAGHIVFHDAWVEPDSLLKSLQLDVMTPHHTQYNIDGSAPPSDLDDPIPVPFLSVCGKFRIVVECDVGNTEGQKWADLALAILTEALKHWGVGGKTSSGYGRFDCHERTS
ncbi:MAG: type III-B CRISPR module RAMP protein Cmr6 [Armatimonadota bacterium]